MKLSAESFKHFPDLIFFGEWGRKNKIKYDKLSYGKWYVFDIWNERLKEYLPQQKVELACKILGLDYIKTPYLGPFVSWNHVRSFLHSPAYGDKQEGVVVKNQDLLSDKENRLPYYIKIVNDDFKESRTIKDVDPEKEEAKINAERLISGIVTENRVYKMIQKLVDDGVLGKEISPEDFKQLISQK